MFAEKLQGNKKRVFSLARCTLGVVTESTNSCCSLGSSKRDSDQMFTREDKMATTASVSAEGGSSLSQEQLRVLSGWKEGNSLSSTPGVSSLQLYSLATGF